MIHCDIRPANMLIDEYGILKLSDFKFVRKIPKVPDGPDNMLAQQVPAAAFGYMAPECLSLSAVPSFASDLWSVGCVLFQLRRGYMPFGSVEPETGVKSGASASRHMYSAIQRTQHVFSRPDPSLRIPVDYDKVARISTPYMYILIAWMYACRIRCPPSRPCLRTS